MPSSNLYNKNPSTFFLLHHQPTATPTHISQISPSATRYFEPPVTAPIHQVPATNPPTLFEGDYTQLSIEHVHTMCRTHTLCCYGDGLDSYRTRPAPVRRLVALEERRRRGRLSATTALARCTGGLQVYRGVRGGAKSAIVFGGIDSTPAAADEDGFAVETRAYATTIRGPLLIAFS